jgi:hypothetical protein
MVILRAKSILKTKKVKTVIPSVTHHFQKRKIIMSLNSVSNGLMQRGTLVQINSLTSRSIPYFPNPIYFTVLSLSQLETHTTSDVLHHRQMSITSPVDKKEWTVRLPSPVPPPLPAPAPSLPVEPGFIYSEEEAESFL